MRIPSLKTRRARVIAAVAAVAVVGGGTWWFLAAQQAGRPEVELATVTRSRITNSVVAVADIEAGDRNTITLSPSVKVVDVLVAEGQRVAAGDLLAVLDTSEFESQLEQQGISLADAESTLRYIAGPSATANNNTAQNAVSQAAIALENARAAEDAARRNLSDVPGFSDSALTQAEIALEGAQLTADAAEANLESVWDLNQNAVRQAQIALDAAKDALNKAERDLADLKARLLAGLITQAEYDAQAPALKFALASAENACRSAQVALDTAEVTADANVALAEKAASDAQLAVESAEATLDAAGLQADSELQAAQQAVSDAQRAVRSAEVTLANAQSAASLARASDSQRANTQQSQVDLLDANIRYLWDKVDQGRLRAGVAGVVSRMDAVADQYPQMGDLIVVEGSGGFLASLDADQADSVGIRPGQRATVTRKGIGSTFEGAGAAVAPVAERSATSADQDPKVTVDVTIQDPDDTLRVGFEADVEVFLDDKEAALTVAVDAVRSEPGTGRRFVFVVADDNRVSRVFIRTGIESADTVEVLAGLAEGQDCVGDPDDSIAEGMTVRIAGGGR